ncbi:cytochrome P450 [Micromonospora sp. WMMD712]|uniref:cytochrome P450 n=1 Tax=Micromonospora sp. WMMD712 TaxID=3016096 RepID=UPI00249BCDE7|nr:cytochrome P450 [Micromonospora sp. WMMD712]WFE60104.1 cytochrome P450 [Micromonospora sp. WMMD712]
MTQTPNAPAGPIDLPKGADAQGLLDWFAYMRKNWPVSWDETRQAWHVFSYRDYQTVTTNPLIFSSDFTSVFPVPSELALLMGPGTIGGIDPPRHAPLRKLVSQAFTPRRIAQLELRIGEITADVLDQVRDQDRIDIASDLAYPLPVTVIAELLGIPTKDHEKFREWVDIILSNEGLEYPNLPDDFTETVGPAIEEWSEFLYAQIAQKRAEPKDDLISGLCAAEVDGRKLTDEEVVNIVALLLTAGHISSATLLSNLFLVLEEHPQAQAAVRADRSLVPGVIEETLRYRSPFNCIFRILNEDTDIFGHPMRKGQMVIAWIASANRDTEVFTDPDAFDIRRESNKHLAFGHGIHHCLGAFLARLEAKVFLNQTLDQFTEFRIDHAGVEFYDADQLTARRLPVQVVRDGRHPK